MPGILFFPKFRPAQCQSNAFIFKRKIVDTPKTHRVAQSKSPGWLKGFIIIPFLSLIYLSIHLPTSLSITYFLLVLFSWRALIDASTVSGRQVGEVLNGTMSRRRVYHLGGMSVSPGRDNPQGHREAGRKFAETCFAALHA